ncbi:hypothetical protein ACGFX4_11675 [Kitasatospora sp. NPDC048365]|uniref:hypothetical protein n=1 Tax=Kitasatospora sp. NPDC048365 TaxID=3364050 RepID=UPI00371D163A
MTFTAVLVNATVVAGVPAGLLLGLPLLRRPAPPRAGRTVAPELVLLAVTALIYLNQLLCAAYLLRVHGGDAGFVTRYLPPGWFAQPTGNPLVRALADHLPAPALFAPTVLRVQAFLELPFVLFAYATVLRRLSPARYRTVLGSGPLVRSTALAYTVVFGVVEWGLYNPWTVQDLLLRTASALVTAPALIALARREPGPDRRPGTLGLLRFTASLWAVGQLVMVVYDTALLYNIGHLGGRWPELLLAVLVLAATARWRTPEPADGASTLALQEVLRRFLVLFLVPALAIRYGVEFGMPVLSVLGALLVTAVALWTRPVRAALLPLLLAGACGLLAAYLAAKALTDTYYESGLLRAMAALLVTATLACAAADRLAARRRAAVRAA